MVLAIVLFLASQDHSEEMNEGMFLLSSLDIRLGKFL